MDNLTITVTRYHEMFRNILQGYGTVFTHNMIALAVKEATGSYDVEALGASINVDGKNYLPIDADMDKAISLHDIDEPVTLTYRYNPKSKVKHDSEVVYIGIELKDIWMAKHPRDGKRRAKILAGRAVDKAGATDTSGYLLIFYHDCLITELHHSDVTKHGVFSHNIRKIDRNGGNTHEES